MHIAITGSNGFIGSELVSYFLAQGHQVLMLQRKPPETLPVNASYQKFDLNDLQTLPDLKGADALIHTAYVPYTKRNGSTAKNNEGTMVLYNLCFNKGVQFIFLSSMSAHANAVSQYGRHKYVLEQQLKPDKSLILKLGLVIGKDGLFSRMYHAFKKMPWAVLVAGGKQPVQPVYIGDVVKVIGQCVVARRTGKYTLAVNRVYSIRQLYTAIAGKAGKKPIFIPVPYRVVSWGIGVVEFFHLPFPVSTENLLGLKQLQPVDTSADLKTLGVTLLDLKQSIDLL